MYNEMNYVENRKKIERKFNKIQKPCGEDICRMGEDKRCVFDERQKQRIPLKKVIFTQVYRKQEGERYKKEKKMEKSNHVWNV